MGDPDVLFAELRSLLQAEPHYKRWFELWTQLDQWPERELVEIALPYAEGQLRGWPARIERFVPTHWLKRLRGGHDVPQLILCDVLSTGADRIGDAGARKIAACAHLRNLTTLELPSPGFKLHGVRALARSPHLGALRKLKLSGIFDPEMMRALGSSQRLSGLTHLDLGHSALDDAAAVALVEELALTSLTMLRLTSTRVGDVGAAALAERAALSSLRSLYLTQSAVGAAGLAALTASPHLAGLESLSIGPAPLGMPGVRALTQEAQMSALKVLWLDGCALGDDAAAELVRSPNLARCEQLNLERTGCGPLTMRAIAATPHLKALRSLRLDQNAIGDDGLRVLLDADNLPALDVLYIVGCDLGEASVDRLIAWPGLHRLTHLFLSANPIKRARAAAQQAAAPGLKMVLPE
jgi:hypothetical protein